MKSDIVKKPSQARCYKCGSVEVVQICHHCGKAICANHISKGGWSSFIFKNREYAKLMLGEEIDKGEKVAAHCEPCRKKYHLPYDRLIFVETALLIGLFSLVGGLYFQRLGLALLSGIFLAGVVLELLFNAKAYLPLFGGYVPALPLIGRVREASIEEQISGKIDLDADRTYTSKVTIAPRGRFNTVFQYTQSAHARYQQYLLKYGSQLGDSLSIHPGYAMLHGENDIELGHEAARSNRNDGVNNIISFEDELNRDRHRFLGVDPTERKNAWPITSIYWIGRIGEENGKEYELPVQLVPTFIKQGNKWGITLQIQSNPKARIDYLLEAGLPIVKSLTLRVLVSEAGEIRDVVPPASVEVEAQGRGGRAYNKIEWREVTAAQDGSHYPIFFIPLREIDHGDGVDEAVYPPETMQLSGELIIEFKGALSKLEKVSYFTPLGHLRDALQNDEPKRQEEKVDLTRTTRVDIKYKLSLDSLVGQELIVDKVELNSRSTFPDHKMIKSLADNLSKSGFYVKRIIENRPHTQKGNANIVNRYWDIIGRSYDGLYPIDFHIIVTGNEYVEGFGRTRIEINVQGKASNDQIKQEIINVKEMLEQRAKSILTSAQNGKRAAEMPLNFDNDYEVKSGSYRLRGSENGNESSNGDNQSGKGDERTVREPTPFDRLSEIRDELSRMSRGIISLQPDLDPIIGMFSRVIGEEPDER